ncbi:uncharacterized protein [Amphiura filiformis]|uniref:uncharacterized protein isoform X2 n=1 Tax=Amphiura filiformis TaxID=82378 RepID=UPI003B21169D
MQAKGMAAMNNMYHNNRLLQEKSPLHDDEFNTPAPQHIIKQHVHLGKYTIKTSVHTQNDGRTAGDLSEITPPKAAFKVGATEVKPIQYTEIVANAPAPLHMIKQTPNAHIRKDTGNTSLHTQTDGRTAGDLSEITHPKTAFKVGTTEVKPIQDTDIKAKNTLSAAPKTAPGNRQHSALHIGDKEVISRSDFIDIEQHVPDLKVLFNRTVIVTATSQNHLGEAKGMIATAQRHMPNTKIIVYDLGLTPDGVKKVDKMCNVEVRKFPFERYPPHVKNIHNYAWKPLLILESLKEFGAIFYGDSSVRFLDTLQILYPYLKQNHGFMQHIHNFDPRNRSGQYHMTHPSTFTQLNINRTAYANDIGYTPWISAGRVLHVNSSFIHKNVLGPLVECSLRLQCIAPEGAHRGKGNLKGANHPHRFDSSVLALVVYKYMRGFYNDDNNSSDLFDKVVKIERVNFSSKGLRVEPKCNT